MNASRTKRTKLNALERRALRTGLARIAEHLQQFGGQPPTSGTKKAIAMFRAFKALHEARYERQ